MPGTATPIMVSRVIKALRGDRSTAAHRLDEGARIAAKLGLLR
ncbi:hypothetical protein [Rhodococcus wratislaviensis]|nr:hypothetical protein [Rhodococcus wratislaviensis]